MDAAQTTIAILGAGTGGLILKSVVDGFISFFSGNAGREKIRNADMKTQRNDAWSEAEKERNRANEAQARADMEARNRNKIADYAAALRRDCMEHGVGSDSLRPWPRLEKDPSN